MKAREIKSKEMKDREKEEGGESWTKRGAG